MNNPGSIVEKMIPLQNLYNASWYRMQEQLGLEKMRRDQAEAATISGALSDWDIDKWKHYINTTGISFIDRNNRFSVRYGAVAVPVVVPLAAKAVVDIANTPEPKLTGQGIMAQIEAASREPQTYTMLTGKEGMKAFNEAMKEYEV